MSAFFNPGARFRRMNPYSDGWNSPFRIYRHVNYSADLRVSAEEYQSKRFDLRDLTEDSRYHYDDVPPPIVVRVLKF
jgi:hypothetical protein